MHDDCKFILRFYTRRINDFQPGNDKEGYKCRKVLMPNRIKRNTNVGVVMVHDPDDGAVDSVGDAEE